MRTLRNRSLAVEISPKESTVATAVVEAAFTARRNFRLGVANGVLSGLLDPLSGVFVLTLFLTALDGPRFLVGLLPAIWSWGILLPQMIVAGKVRGKQRVMPWYKRAAIIRVTGLAGMAVCAALMAANRDAVLPVFFASYLLYAVGCGVSGIPFIEIVGKIVPDHRKGTFFGLRQVGSAALSMVTSAVAGLLWLGTWVSASRTISPLCSPLPPSWERSSSGSGAWCASRTLSL